jgi:predicted AAA+ superfamily ATPase
MVNIRTAERYLDILEKSFIITSLGPYSRNLRSELRSKKKYYFLDCGIRNAVISQFNDLESRNDVGALWENFLVVERIKAQAYTQTFANNYFWRTWEQQEIDWVEERDGKLFGFEFKWGKNKYKKPMDFLESYPGSSISVITPDNYLEFVTKI